MIPLDFVPGTHGHFLEIILNQTYGFTSVEFDPFTNLGTSHRRPESYLKSRQIICNHWFDNCPSKLSQSSKVIRIVFDQDDLLLVSSLSLLRSSDLNINNNTLHIDTVNKLNNREYRHMLASIYQSYDFLDPTNPNIPRNVLREFYKFGFRTPSINGIWGKLQEMISIPTHNEFRIDLKKIYVLEDLIRVLETLGSWLDRPVQIGDWLTNTHSKFISKIPYLGHRSICENLIQCIVNQDLVTIPPLSLMQESYINGRLEDIFKKEMPFQQDLYFTNTEDVLYYINNQAPNL